MANFPPQTPERPPEHTSNQLGTNSILDALHSAAAREVEQLLSSNREGYLLQLAGAAGPLCFEKNLPFAHQVLVSREQEIPGWAKICGNDSLLPVGTGTMAAILVVHILDYQKRPELLMNEMARVLDSEGQLIVCGFNPWSLCNLMRIPKRSNSETCSKHLNSPNRLSRVLMAHNFVIEREQTIFYRFPINHPWALQQDGLLEKLGPRLLPSFGGVYLISARKRLAAFTPLRRRWKNQLPRRVAVVTSSALEAAD